MAAKSRPRKQSRVDSRRGARVTAKSSAAKEKRKQPRGPSSRQADTRTLILEAAELLMSDEGYAAVTSRRLGAVAGVRSALVHYYFRNMDDLFLALWHRYLDGNLMELSQSFLSRQPLRSVWKHLTNSQNGSLGAELMALGRHRKVVGEEIARTAERVRKMQAGALSDIMDQYGLRESFGSPEVLTVLIAGLARMLVTEEEIGIFYGHQDTRALVERWLEKFERRAEKPDGAE